MSIKSKMIYIKLYEKKYRIVYLCLSIYIYIYICNSIFLKLLSFLMSQSDDKNGKKKKGIQMHTRTHELFFWIVMYILTEWKF